MSGCAAGAALAASLGRGFVANPVHVGLSIGIVTHGDTRQFHFGSIDRRQAIAPTGQTIYELASLTKSYTGMLLAKAVVEGKIALEDDVRRYLPTAYTNLSFDGQPIRIADLASHTSGLPKNLPAFAAGATPRQLLRQQGDVSRATFLRALAQVKLTVRPGTVYAYSNAGAQLIGLVLERVYDMDYASLLRRAITTPRHMPDTVTVVAPRDATRYARHYDGYGRTMPELTFWHTLPAAGFIKSTVDDQLRYLAWNLDSSDPAVALAHRVVFRHTDERGDDIGLFWFVNRTRNGTRLVRHAGGSFGTTSFALLYPDAGIGIVLLANDADSSTEQTLADMAEALADSLNGETKKNPAHPHEGEYR
jgi:D-alanyl-D-alanine-carboxypeptidase/D-alanyl-D-alanine-endopeptidase